MLSGRCPLTSLNLSSTKLTDATVVKMLRVLLWHNKAVKHSLTKLNLSNNDGIIGHFTDSIGYFARYTGMEIVSNLQNYSACKLTKIALQGTGISVGDQKLIQRLLLYHNTGKWPRELKPSADNLVAASKLNTQPYSDTLEKFCRQLHLPSSLYHRFLFQGIISLELLWQINEDDLGWICGNDGNDAVSRIAAFRTKAGIKPRLPSDLAWCSIM